VLEEPVFNDDKKKEKQKQEQAARKDETSEALHCERMKWVKLFTILEAQALFMSSLATFLLEEGEERQTRGQRLVAALARL
jgi:hypothetical protein